jgi:hypothetical protein
VAIGSYDEKMRLLNCLTWRLVKEFEHKTNLSEYDDFVIIIIII